MRKFGKKRFYGKLARLFKRHRHVVRKSMRGLTSIPVRFRGRRI